MRKGVCVYARREREREIMIVLSGPEKRVRWGEGDRGDISGVSVLARVVV